MQKLIVFAIIGFFAQLIDGALGMAYGVTSTSLLLMFGIAPAVASASVHLAEVVTTAASGDLISNLETLINIQFPGLHYLGQSAHLLGHVFKQFTW